MAITRAELEERLFVASDWLKVWRHQSRRIMLTFTWVGSHSLTDLRGAFAEEDAPGRWRIYASATQGDHTSQSDLVEAVAEWYRLDRDDVVVVGSDD